MKADVRVSHLFLFLTKPNDGHFDMDCNISKSHIKFSFFELVNISHCCGSSRWPVERIEICLKMSVKPLSSTVLISVQSLTIHLVIISVSLSARGHIYCPELGETGVM